MLLMNNQTQDTKHDRDDRPLTITIHINDTEPIRFPIRRSEERIYRMAEYHVNQLCKDWAQAHPHKSTADILARVALAFAELYYRKTDQINQQEKIIADFEHELDRMLNPGQD